MEKTYRTYKKMVKVSFDPTEGIVRVRVNAADPGTSVAFSKALITYAEEQIDHLTERLRSEQMKGAREIYNEAEQKMRGAQEAFIAMQKQAGSINPSAQGEAVSARISRYEDEIQAKRLELASILDNPRPNPARVEGVQTDIARLESVLADLRKEISSGADGGTESLADLSSSVRMAELELSTRQGMLQQALANLENARIEADRQVRYVAVNVQPVAPDEPTYPRVIEDTILTFFVLMGIYLMISVTASILREQVSA
jgi:capsular polysaccharide transport system permease protein